VELEEDFGQPAEFVPLNIPSHAVFRVPVSEDYPDSVYVVIYRPIEYERIKELSKHALIKPLEREELVQHVPPFITV
jgi:hypothetical protein